MAVRCGSGAFTASGLGTRTGVGRLTATETISAISAAFTARPCWGRSAEREASLARVYEAQYGKRRAQGALKPASGTAQRIGLGRIA